MIDFEMQMERDKDINRRMRMYESSFNLAFLANGSLYSCLPSFTMIWLYGEDPHGRGEGGVHVAVEGPGEHGDG